MTTCMREVLSDVVKLVVGKNIKELLDAKCCKTTNYK